MENKIFDVLFLCTGNSARSIFAECLTNRLGRGKFRGFSAGSHPKGEINPFTLYELERNNYDLTGLRSKDLAEFSTPGAPKMDFIFTVCDKAAAEVCPVWPGHPMTAHWGVPDPAEVEGDAMTQRAAFVSAFLELQNRISAFVSLPLESLEKIQLKTKLDDIGNLHIDAKETLTS